YSRAYDSKEKFGIVHKYTQKVVWYINFVLKNLYTRKDYGDFYPEDYLVQHGVTYYDDFCHVSDRYLYKDKKVLRKIFSFPQFDDNQNKIVSEQMCNVNSVAIHVRRSDHMYDNGSLFRRKYFKNAVNYIKKNVENPFFYIFSEDLRWCKDNLEACGIDEGDQYLIVDWNHGSESYRDMQLMTYCKNNVLVMSSFSWCGYYLSIHDEKIVIAPKGWWLEVPVHM
ncbi:MAG: alpha-1,2-fucosyltransferase, partial [Lachnospiraceae bacterium]|nr:alpha-1,2-fucosyltransferase [Lachnospiraceae bacterium]